MPLFVSQGGVPTRDKLSVNVRIAPVGLEPTTSGFAAQCSNQAKLWRSSPGEIKDDGFHVRHPQSHLLRLSTSTLIYARQFKILRFLLAAVNSTLCPFVRLF